jgi:hypothetical protein
LLSIEYTFKSDGWNAQFKKRQILANTSFIVVQYMNDSIRGLPTISFKSVGTDATKPLNFNKRQTPPPPAQCCVPFLVRFDSFWLKQHWLGWGEG